MHPNSFHNIKSKWLPELKQFAPNATLFLVGTKTDLLDDKATLKELKELNEEPISQKQATALQKEIGAHLYLTCSGKDVASVNKVFRDALHFLLEREKKQLEKEKKQWKKELKELQQIEKELAKLRLQQRQEYAANAAANNNNNNTNNHSAATSGGHTAATNNDDDDDDSDAPAQPNAKAPTDNDDDDDDDSGGKRRNHKNHADKDDDDVDDSRSADDADRPKSGKKKGSSLKKKATSNKQSN